MISMFFSISPIYNSYLLVIVVHTGFNLGKSRIIRYLDPRKQDAQQILRPSVIGYLVFC